MPFKNLISGYRSFHKNYFGGGKKLFRTLVRDGQAPETLIISCSDSRTDPAVLTGSSPGDIFVVRNVAAIVPPYKTDSNHHGTSAAIEFAVRTLKVKHIVVMGHSFCGGCRALAEKEALRGQYEFLSRWMEIGNPALEKVERELAGAPESVKRRALEQALVLVSLGNLLTFPWIKSAIEAQSVELHGWYFDLESGALLTHNPASGIFEEIKTSA
ncbi:MAG: carbonic anhydrase [Alphaproteobacteria bacterium]|nr:carbonic anhydrase [Alphaproteobacteria bacterium]